MTKLSIKDIKPNPNNPRIIKDDKFKKLVQSIKDFPEMADVREIVINKDNVILGGNMRFKAMKEAGWKEVPVRVVDWDEEKQRQFIIKDNVSGGEWDWDALANQWDSAELDDWGLDLPDSFGDDKEVIEDEAPEIDNSEPPKSKLGEIYQLGRHRVMCGDSTDAGNVALLMNGVKADMVFTDPPYSVNYEKKQNEVLGNKKYNHIENDDMSVKDISDDIWRPVFKNLYDNAKDDCSFYLTMPQGGDQMMMMMMMNENWQVKHELIWVKPSPVFSMGRLDYDYKHEPIAYGWKKSHNFYGKGQFTKSVWEFGRDSDGSHPTMKPIELINNALQNSTKDKDVVIDYFLGSGSTIIACEQTNRICYGMELDPKYVDVIWKRYWKFVNGTEEGWQDGTKAI